MKEPEILLPSLLWPGGRPGPFHCQPTEAICLSLLGLLSCPWK